MKVTVIGKRFASGTSKKTNKPYSGFFLSYIYTASGYEGNRCSEKFITSQSLQGIVPDIGDKLDLDFDENGYITGVTILDTGKEVPGRNMNAGK